MKVPKSKALQLINDKISEFETVLNQATYENRYDNAYNHAYYGTETLLTELFSEKEAMKFRNEVAGVYIGILGGHIDYAKELRNYKNHINLCISQLRVYEERISNFWADEPETNTPTELPSKMEKMTAELLFEQIITHPTINQVSFGHFKNGDYRSAVLDAAIRLEEMIKVKANYPEDNNGNELSGVKLMHKVFDPNNPILCWCDNKRQIEKDEIEGYKLIFAGTVLGIRNPKAHAIFQIEPMRALKLLTLIVALAELIDASKLVEKPAEHEAKGLVELG